MRFTNFYAQTVCGPSQGFDVFFGTSGSNDGTVNLYRQTKLIEKKTDMAALTRRYTDEAIAFIETKKDGPFFVYLAHTMPHTKLAASKKFKDKSAGGLYGDVIEELDFNVGCGFRASCVHRDEFPPEANAMPLRPQST